MTLMFNDMLAIVLSVGYLILLIVAARNTAQLGSLERPLLLTLFMTLLVQLSHLLPLINQQNSLPIFAGDLKPQMVSVYLTSLMLIMFFALTLRYLQRGSGIVFLLLGFVWLAAIIFLDFQPQSPAVPGTAGWLSKVFTDNPDLAGAVMVGGWIVIGVLSLLFAFYSFYRAHLPEIGNRSLFWIMLIPLVLMGAVLGVSGSDVLKEIGWTAQFTGMVGAVYAAVAHRIVDIRRVLRSIFSSSIVTIITAGVILAALAVSRSVEPSVENSALVWIAVAILAAILYAPIRSFILSIVNRFLGSTAEDSAGALRRYSEDIAGVVELEPLIDVAMNTLRDRLKVRRGGLILATRDDNDTIRLEAFPRGLGDMPEVRGWIPKGSPVYRALFDQRSTLLQFDLEYSRQYSDVAPELKSFFKTLRMSAYAPIVVQNQLIGVLAAGAKTNDNPFYPQDLELLATLANQTGIALRNARLVNDLRKASEEMQSLNKEIVGTKERIERLDSVKTDFITIASHELRTPLAQIRGYTDILDALNEQGMLDPDQMTGMTNNLRKATDRLERLIGDMLDVSQLGLDAMDLRFASTTTENVLRLAIEPLQESIRQRKLTLVARGLRDLPPIEADMQRLVQAFRNVVTNAIKYTPDGGRIDITALVQQNGSTKRDEILIAIKDSGIGIDPKNHELIFEKFFRVADPGLHSTGATKFMGAGPGLGLTIARGVIEGHGGRIWVESSGYDPENLPGTTFYIVLPMAPPETAKRVLAFESTQSLSVSAIASAVAEATAATTATPTADPAPATPGEPAASATD